MKSLLRFRSLPVLLSALMIVICAACSADQPQPSAGTPTSASDGNGTAATALVSPVKSPLATSIPIIKATQDAKLGRVTGKLRLGSDSNNKPVPGRILYLAILTKDANGKETGAGLDRISAPRTFSDADGAFVFVNVPLGRYTIIMDMVTTAYLLHRPTDQTDLIAEVKAGQTVDFGTLVYDQLPN